MTGPVAGGAEQFEATVASFVRDNRLYGTAAGIVHGDELVWSGGAGFADQAAGRPSGPDVLYRIASITKTFTGTAILQLRDAGKLDLDDPVVKWVPELADSASPETIGGVTIRRLLSHESGLVGEPPGTDFTAQPPSYQGVIARNLDAGQRDLHRSAAEYPGQVLQSRLPAARRDRQPGCRDAVPAIRLQPHPAAAADVVDRLRAARFRLGGAARCRVLGARVLRRTVRRSFDAADLGRGRPLVGRDRPREMALVPARAHPRPGTATARRLSRRCCRPRRAREMHKPRYLSDEEWSDRVGYLLVLGAQGRRDLGPALRGLPATSRTSASTVPPRSAPSRW